MKLFEHHETDRTLDRLPELPPGVQVPDDISGLHAPTTRKPTTEGVRWMRWLAAVVLIGGAGALTVALLMSGNDEPTPADDPTTVGDMQLYGTDNPAFVEDAPGPRTVEIVGTQSQDVDLMERYGTDNPVFVLADTGEYFELYGTDNPVFVLADTGEYFKLYGTDNPVFVPDATYMELYGTDNPVFVPDTGAEPADTGENFRLYGTDNPVFVDDTTGEYRIP